MYVCSCSVRSEHQYTHSSKRWTFMQTGSILDAVGVLRHGFEVWFRPGFILGVRVRVRV